VGGGGGWGWLCGVWGVLGGGVLVVLGVNLPGRGDVLSALARPA
jgi:hypothetical protein